MKKDPICYCFLSIWNKNNKCNYNDNTLLKETEFNEGNKILIGFNKIRECKCGKIHPKKYSIILREWKKNQKGEKYAENLKDYTYTQEFREEFTIKDIKIFIQNKSNQELITPVCVCFLSVWEYIKEENKWNLYSDDIKLNDTKFSEKNPMLIYIDKIDKKCECQKYESFHEIFEVKKQNSEQEKNLLTKINDLQAQLDENERIKEEEENRKKIEEEKREIGEEDFNNNIGNIIKNFYDNNKVEIFSNLDNDIENYFKENISFINMEQISILKKNFANNIINFLKIKLKLKDLNYQISHFNILVLGFTGAGKSTLINKVLKTEKAKTSYGSIGTKNIKSYESEKSKGIKILHVDMNLKKFIILKKPLKIRKY